MRATTVRLGALVLPVLLCSCDGGAPLGEGGISHDARRGEPSRVDAPRVEIAVDVADGGRLPDVRPDHAPITPDAGQLRDDAIAPWTWFQQASVLCDQSALGAAFAAAGYTPPTGAYLIAARVLPGLGQPAFQYYSLAATGWTYSASTFWPASTVKLTAAVGALRTLGSKGLTGAAQVSFTDDDGAYAGTVKSLYTQAIEVSSNEAYNRLMEIAGFDELNDQYLVPAESLPQMVLQRRYTHPLPTSNLRVSPVITYSEGTVTGQLPQRVGVGQHPECPSEGNCTTLFELLDVLRRVALHNDVPASDRFPLAPADVASLQGSLLASPTAFEPGASSALGHTAQIYNKDGQVWTDDHLDHGLVVDPVTGDRFLLAMSVPYSASSAAQLSELARRTLLALLAQPTTGVALQRTAGVPITVQLDDQGPVAGGRRYKITIDAPGADAIEVWVDGWVLGSFTGPAPFFARTHDFTKSGDRLMTVRARAKGAVVGYRALTVHLN